MPQGPGPASAAPCRGRQSTVGNGAAVTCTINNNDQPATLTLVKNVVNDNGGTAIASRLDPRPRPARLPISGPGNSASVTNQTVNAGNYALSESGGPAGYTAGSWTCTGGTLAGCHGHGGQRRQCHVHDHQ